MSRSRSKLSGFRRITGLSGQHVVFTGRFDPNRSKVEYIAEEAGATVSNHVTTSTTLLVLGRPSALYKFDGYGTKIAAARTITPKTFIAEINDETFRLLAEGRTVDVTSRERALISAFGVPAAIPSVSGRKRKAVLAPVLGDEFDRATQEHQQTLIALCDTLTKRGWTPLTPGTGMPVYDLAVDAGSCKYVIEVKSIRPGINETEQVRLGVGQVLHYTGSIAAASKLPLKQLVPIVVTSQPARKELVLAYKQHGIAICHPGDIHRVIKKASRR